MELVTFQRPDQKKLNIEIFSHVQDSVPRKKAPARHRHDFHSITFFLAGKSIQEIEFDEYHIQAGQVLIIPKGAIHWEKSSEKLFSRVILFQEDFFSDLQKQLLHAFMQHAIAMRKLLIKVPEAQLNQLETYFNLLEVEQQGEENQNQTFILQNLMLALLNKLEGLNQYVIGKNTFIAIRKPFQRFIELVEKHYVDQKKVEFYASQLQISPRKLNEIIRSLTGQTASSYLIDRIITEAKRELCFGEKSIKEVAFGLGYESQYYFSRIFKKKTDLSPEQFRESFAE